MKGVLTVNCILMHKNIMVIELFIDDDTGYVADIGRVLNFAHLPIGTSKNGSSADKALLNKWWTERSIPASRQGLYEALQILRISSPKLLLSKCFGLSLSDQYWIKPENSDLSWDEINFFDNDFSEDLGDILFGRATDTDNISLNSPDNTSDGCLKKRWKIINGQRYLIKAGSPPFEQQPFNEAIASLVMDKLGVEHVGYSVIIENGKPYSICEDFITHDTELVTASKILQAFPKPNHLSVYEHYINCCKTLGINDIVKKIDQMIIVDFIIANEDRHFNNFGLIRNADTLQWIGTAPVYDNGSSLGFDKVTQILDRQSGIVCKPFRKNHFDQLKLVSSFDGINLSSLNDIDGEIFNILQKADPDLIDEARQQKIVSSVHDRIDYLKNLISEQN